MPDIPEDVKSMWDEFVQPPSSDADKDAVNPLEVVKELDAQVTPPAEGDEKEKVASVWEQFAQPSSSDADKDVVNPPEAVKELEEQVTPPAEGEEKEKLATVWDEYVSETPAKNVEEKAPEPDHDIDR